MRKLIILSLAFWMGSAGCASTSVYVLHEKELIRVKAGETIEVKFDGFLLSDRAVDRVMDTKIKKINLQ